MTLRRKTRSTKGSRGPLRISHALLLFAIIAVTAVCYPALKTGLESAPPWRFAGLRTLIGGLFLLALLPVLKRSLWPRRELAKWIVPLALLATTLTFGSMFLSPAFAAAGIGSILGNIQPLCIIILAALFLGERMSTAKTVALSLGLAGIALIAGPLVVKGDLRELAGAAFAVVSSVSAASASVLVKRLQPGSDVLALTAWQLILGSLPLLALSALVERDARITWSLPFSALLLFLAATALTTVGWFWLLQHYEAGTLSLYLFLVPIAGLLLAYLIRGETLGPTRIAGVLLVLAGLGAAVSGRRLSHSSPMTISDCDQQRSLQK